MRIILAALGIAFIWWMGVRFICELLGFNNLDGTGTLHGGDTPVTKPTPNDGA